MELILLYIAVLYVVTPMIIKYKHFYKRFGEPQRLFPHAFPTEISNYFIRIETELAALGFTSKVYFKDSGRTNNSTTYYSLCINYATQEYAIVAFVTVKNSLVKKSFPLIFINTEYQGGTKVITHNSSQPRVFKKRENRKVRHIPNCQNIGLLYQIHQQYVNEIGISEGRVLPPEGKEEFYFYNQSVEEFDAQIRAGYYYYDPKANEYRLTFKGAYIVGWKLIWPIKQLQMYMLNSEAQQVIKQLNRPSRFELRGK